jgi:hypothetical protein
VPLCAHYHIPASNPKNPPPAVLPDGCGLSREWEGEGIELREGGKAKGYQGKFTW